MNLTRVKNLIILEAIRKTKVYSKESWKDFSEIERLVADNLLSIDSGKLAITPDGKKGLLLFDADKRELLKDLEPYLGVSIRGNLIDARIPVMAFLSKTMPEVYDILHSVAIITMWDSFFEYLLRQKKQKKDWQKLLKTDYLINSSKQRVRLDAWKVLGSSDDDAKRTAVLLLNPAKRQDNKLVQITRSYV